MINFQNSFACSLHLTHMVPRLIDIVHITIFSIFLIFIILSRYFGQILFMHVRNYQRRYFTILSIIIRYVY